MTNFLAENGAGGGGAIFYTPLNMVNMLRESKIVRFHLSSNSFKSLINSLYLSILNFKIKYQEIEKKLDF